MSANRVVKNLYFIVMAAAATTSGLTARAALPKISAPYGYTWGQAQTTIMDLIECIAPRPGLSLCKTWSPPRPRPAGKHYWLLFGEKAGLISVVATSHNITGDKRGRIGRQRFAAAKQELQAQYPGAPVKEIAFQSNYLQANPDKFYECLQTAGCSQYVFQVQGAAQGRAGVMLQGTAPGQGHVFIMHESPAYQATRAAAAQLAP